MKEAIDKVRIQTEKFLFDNHTHAELIKPEEVVYRSKDVEDVIDCLLETIDLMYKEIKNK